MRGWVRDLTRAEGQRARRASRRARRTRSRKFQDYYDFSEPLGSIPSHRVLAIRRGEDEGVLVVDRRRAGRARSWPARSERVDAGRRGDGSRCSSSRRTRTSACSRSSIEVDLRLELKTRADEEAIAIFGRNLEQLLLARAGGRAHRDRPRSGLPHRREGRRGVAHRRRAAHRRVDAAPAGPLRRGAAAPRRAPSAPELIAIGNGTASRETEALVRETLARRDARVAAAGRRRQRGRAHRSTPRRSSRATSCPDLDVSLRGAVSIARRLQDPLAELVKIDPEVDRRRAVPARRQPAAAEEALDESRRESA